MDISNNNLLFVKLMDVPNITEDQVSLSLQECWYIRMFYWWYEMIDAVG